MKRPLFIGHSDIDQLYKIFEVLGLPSDADWPVNSVIPLKSFHSNANLSSKSQRGAESFARSVSLVHKFFTHGSRNQRKWEWIMITRALVQKKHYFKPQEFRYNILQGFFRVFITLLNNRVKKTRRKEKNS